MGKGVNKPEARIDQNHKKKTDTSGLKRGHPSGTPQHRTTGQDRARNRATGPFKPIHMAQGHARSRHNQPVACGAFPTISTWRRPPPKPPHHRCLHRWEAAATRPQGQYETGLTRHLLSTKWQAGLLGAVGIPSSYFSFANIFFFCRFFLRQRERNSCPAELVWS